MPGKISLQIAAASLATKVRGVTGLFFH